MAEEKNMARIDEEELKNVAGGVRETSYGNPHQSQFVIGQMVHFWDDTGRATDGYVRDKRWDVTHYRSEDCHEWIYTIEGKFDHKIYERPERQVV